MTRQQRWMKAGAAVVMATGVAMALGAHPVTAGPLRLLADVAIWPPDAAQTLASPEVRVFAAIAGGLMVGWGWVLWLLAGEGMERMPGLSRRMWVGSVAAWFAVDSAGSLAAGVPLNVLGNLGFLALLLVPVLGGRRPVPAGAG